LLLCFFLIAALCLAQDHLLMLALERGISVHHSGQTKEYLDLVR
jgi:hypothetical protein